MERCRTKVVVVMMVVVVVVVGGGCFIGAYFCCCAFPTLECYQMDHIFERKSWAIKFLGTLTKYGPHVMEGR